MYQIVICNGGYRTGSTLSFNIVLKLFEKAGRVFESFGANNQPLRTLCALHPMFLRYHWVIKSHDYIPERQYDHVRMIHTSRHPCAVAASRFNMTMPEDPVTLDNAIQMLKLQQGIHETLVGREDALLLEYKELYNGLADVIRKIAVFLDMPTSDQIVSEIASELSVEKVREVCDNLQVADPYTQLRPHHISKFGGSPDAWREVLTPEFVERIRTEVGEI